MSEASEANASDLFISARQVRSFEDIVEQIRDAILSGQLKDGEKLASERELCGIFGVSRPTLREALRWLEASGFVKIRAGSHGGIIAVHPDGAQMGTALDALLQLNEATAQDLAEFRVSFEGENAFWAAQRSDDADIARMREVLEAMEESLRRPETPWKVLSELDLRFHQLVANAAKNRVRSAVMLGVLESLKRASLSLEQLMSGQARHSIVEELAGIVWALESHDAQLARTRMAEHVDRFSEMEAQVFRQATATSATQ